MSGINLALPAIFQIPCDYKFNASHTQIHFKLYCGANDIISKINNELVYSQQITVFIIIINILIKTSTLNGL